MRSPKIVVKNYHCIPDMAVSSGRRRAVQNTDIVMRGVYYNGRSCATQRVTINTVYVLRIVGLADRFIARDSIYAKRAYAIAIPSVCPSVRPSVCLSHG